MERPELTAKAAAWMQARGWRRKLAKRRPHEQSLFEHTLIRIIVRLERLPIRADGGYRALQSGCVSHGGSQ